MKSAARALAPRPARQGLRSKCLLPLFFSRVPVHSRAASLRKFRDRRLWNCTSSRALPREGVEINLSTRPRVPRAAEIPRRAPTAASAPHPRAVGQRQRKPHQIRLPQQPVLVEDVPICRFTVVTLRPGHVSALIQRLLAAQRRRCFLSACMASAAFFEAFMLLVAAL